MNIYLLAARNTQAFLLCCGWDTLWFTLVFHGRCNKKLPPPTADRKWGWDLEMKLDSDSTSTKGWTSGLPDSTQSVSRVLAQGIFPSWRRVIYQLQTKFLKGQLNPLTTHKTFRIDGLTVHLSPVISDWLPNRGVIQAHFIIPQNKSIIICDLCQRGEIKLHWFVRHT